MTIAGVVAQELVELHIPPMGPGLFADSDGFPFPAASISLPGALFAGLVVDTDTIRAHTVSTLTPVQTLRPDWFMGVAEVFYSPTVAMAGPGYTFDSTTATAVTLSNNNLTATHSTNANNSGVKGISFLVAGKYYYEATVGATHGNNDTVGIAASAQTYTQVASSATVVNLKTGNIGTSGKSLGAVSVGDVIGILTDITGLLWWARKNGGLWNDDPGADPVLGIGGIPIPTNLSWAPVVGFAGGGRQAGDNVTANFGATAYQTAAPSGFVNWPTGVMLLAPGVSDPDAFHAPTIANANTVLAPACHIDFDVFIGPPGQTQAMTAGRAGVGSVVTSNQGTGGKTQAIPGSGIATFPVLGVATISTSVVLPLAPAAYVDADVVPAATITGLAPSQTLSAVLFDDGDAFMTPVINSDVPVDLFIDTDSFHGPSVTTDAMVQPDLLGDADTFYAPSVSLTLMTRSLSASRAGVGSVVVTGGGDTQIISNVGAVTQ